MPCKGHHVKKSGSREEPDRLLMLHILSKLKHQTLYKMKGRSSTKSGILWDTTKSMKLHHIEPASLHFPRSLIVRAMRGQSATSSTSKQTVMIFRAVTNQIIKVSNQESETKTFKFASIWSICQCLVFVTLVWTELQFVYITQIQNRLLPLDTG